MSCNCVCSRQGAQQQQLFIMFLDCAELKPTRKTSSGMNQASKARIALGGRPNSEHILAVLEGNLCFGGKTAFQGQTRVCCKLGGNVRCKVTQQGHDVNVSL